MSRGVVDSRDGSFARESSCICGELACCPPPATVQRAHCLGKGPASPPVARQRQVELFRPQSPFHLDPPIIAPIEQRVRRASSTPSAPRRVRRAAAASACQRAQPVMGDKSSSHSRQDPDRQLKLTSLKAEGRAGVVNVGFRTAAHARDFARCILQGRDLRVGLSPASPPALAAHLPLQSPSNSSIWTVDAYVVAAALVPCDRTRQLTLCSCSCSWNSTTAASVRLSPLQSDSDSDSYPHWARWTPQRQQEHGGGPASQVRVGRGARTGRLLAESSSCLCLSSCLHLQPEQPCTRARADPS